MYHETKDKENILRAIALLSGGLDSTLAIRIVMEYGIEVEAVNFFTPFCQCSCEGSCGYEAKKVVDRLGIKLKVFNIFGEYIEMIKNPRYGYGKNLNPCIDCRIMMYTKAREYMKKTGASFVITGEVLGQRPMSQHRRAINIIEKESGLEGLILRPLSAKLFPPSIPEKEGWVNREKLLGISGRSRKFQIALAEHYEINDYPCPAGGCLLTDAGFTRRMKDLMQYSDITLSDIEPLKVGRHFRLSPQAKVIVGRNKQENEKLVKLINRGYIYFRPVDIKGPVGIGHGNFNRDTMTLASRIIARYSDIPQTEKDSSFSYEVKVAVDDSIKREKNFITVNIMDKERLDNIRI